MESNDFDDDILIAYVEKFEFLWNKNSKGYKDKNTKENGWKNIGKILRTDGDVCRRRFDTLRNRYVTFKRKMNKSSGSLDGQESPSSSATDWSSMNFLDKYIKHRKKGGAPAKKSISFTDKVPDDMVLIVQPDSIENKAQIIKMENTHEEDSENENYDISYATTEKPTTRKRRLCQITPQDFYEESSMTDSSIESSSKHKHEKIPATLKNLQIKQPEKNETPTNSVTDELLKLSKQLKNTTSSSTALAAENDNNQNSKQSDVVEAFATYLCAQLHQIQCKKKQRRTINQISSYAMQVINEALSDDE